MYSTERHWETSKQSAWEAHARWIEDQAEQRRSGHEGMDEDWAAAARALAGELDEQPTS